jgi:putative membrane protein
VIGDYDRQREPAAAPIGLRGGVGAGSAVLDGTALAWVRTSLALVAAGVGLTSLARLADLAPALDGLAALICLLGAALAANAMLGWRRRELALRTGQPLPAPAGLFWLVAGIIVVAVVLAVYVAFAS